MRDGIDIDRSIKRYLAMVLDTTGEVYDVRSLREEPTERPSAVIRSVGPLSDGPGASHTAEYTQSYEVYGYPVDQETSEQSYFHAKQLQRLIIQALRVGILPGRACRMPIWDYTDVDVGSPLADDAEPAFFGRVAGIQAQVLPDPEVDTLYTVQADFRVTWRDRADRHIRGQLLGTSAIDTDAAADVTDPVKISGEFS